MKELANQSLPGWNLGEGHVFLQTDKEECLWSELQNGCGEIWPLPTLGDKRALNLI